MDRRNVAGSDRPFLEFAKILALGANAGGPFRIEADLGRRGLAALTIADGGYGDAIFGALRGDDAALAIVGLSGVSFSLARSRPPVHAGAGTLEGLLLEASRLTEELDARQAGLPSPDSLLLATAAVSQDPLRCGVRTVGEFLRFPHTLNELLGEVRLAPVKVRLAVAYLAEAGYLAEVSQIRNEFRILLLHTPALSREELHQALRGLCDALMAPEPALTPRAVTILGVDGVPIWEEPRVYCVSSPTSDYRFVALPTTAPEDAVLTHVTTADVIVVASEARAKLPTVGRRIVQESPFRSGWLERATRECAQILKVPWP